MRGQAAYTFESREEESESDEDEAVHEALDASFRLPGLVSLRINARLTFDRLVNAGSTTLVALDLSRATLCCAAFVRSNLRFPSLRDLRMGGSARRHADGRKQGYLDY